MKKVLLLLLFFGQNAFSQVEKRVLVFSKNAPWAYRHASIEAGKRAIFRLCGQQKIKADTTEDAAVFTDEKLRNYAAIVFMSANQDVFDADQEKALQHYVRAGGGIVGIHSSCGMERNWKWFSDMMGGTFDWHTEQQNAEVVQADAKNALSKGLPKRWKHRDEWYLFKNTNPNVKVISYLDSTTYKSSRHPQNYPSSWTNEFENGRIFYTALGHNDADFADKIFLKQISNGLKYAIGKNVVLDYSKVAAFDPKPAQLLTVAPGHFHSALVQKYMIAALNPEVYVYSADNQEVNEHLKRIEGYNKRADQPTAWVEKVYKGDDFFEKMIAEKKGNVVVLAGNNQLKTQYIKKSVEAGLHVLADKPMCIDSKGFETLQAAFVAAKKNNVLLYDIMTERSEITTLLQKELSQIPEIFGKLELGTPDNPSVVKESVHHFYKIVSGSPLIRPNWFMDVAQEGEGIVDVTTHLVDLVQWECFPELPLTFSDVKINSAKRWSTAMTLPQFEKITGQSSFPNFLKKDVEGDSVLKVFCNGEFNYALKGVNAKVKVTWNYAAKEGGDTHYSIMKGTKANLEIRQGAAEKFTTQLFIQPKGNLTETEIQAAFLVIKKKYEGIELLKQESDYQLIVPAKLRTNHESHFGEVMERFLKYYQTNNLPDWEVSNMLVKYFTTTQALEKAK